MKVNEIPCSTNVFTNPFSSAQSSLTLLNEQQLKLDVLTEQINLATQISVTGNGYQKLPFHLPPSHTILDNSETVDHQLASKLNRMYTQSPQLPRKVYEFNPNMNNIIQPSQPLHQPSQLNQPIQHYLPSQPLQITQIPQLHQHQPPQLHHMGATNQSPYMTRKFASNEPDYGTHYSPYKPLPQHQPQSTFSPVIRKRYQEGHLVSEDLEFRILHGNTSPIVLQRFYHQQNQLKDQKEEDQLRAIRMQSGSPNPYKHTQSSIPVKSGSPLPNPRFQQQQQQQHQHQQQVQMLQRNILHHQHQQQHHEPTYNNASHKLYESHIPQLQSRMISNGNGTIPYRQHQLQQPMYDNIAQRAQLACPSSPQLDRLRANLEKPNFYERHQKLPVEIESYQMESGLHQFQGNGLNADIKNKDKGKSSMHQTLSLRHPSRFMNVSSNALPSSTNQHLFVF